MVFRRTFEFNCPRCGGHYFGTVGGPDSKDYWKGAQGHCNGDDDARHCQFKWPRTEDWLYFGEVVTTKFNSKEEYEAAKAREFGEIDASMVKLN
jgi:hypothetical protein